MKKGAIISECGLFRYQLWRIWDDTKPLVLFIMHNPSKADAETDDPTIIRCINFAKGWGYGGLMVGNICAYRATKPKDIAPVQRDDLQMNRLHISQLRAMCKDTIMACGVIKRPDIKWLFKMLYPSCIISPKVIDTTASGWPAHPLYLKGIFKPIPYRTRQNEKTN